MTDSRPPLTPPLIDNAEALSALAARLQTEKLLALDTEFIRESTFFPIIEVIQIANKTETWLIDAQKFKKNHNPADPFDFDPGIVPILELLKNPKITKIVHAAQGDQECLYTSFGTLAEPLLDTAVAASLCGYGESIGLSKLLKKVLNLDLHKGHARTNWSARPLPLQLLLYAELDVRYLVELGLCLLDELDQKNRRDWAFELSSRWSDPSLYTLNLDELIQKSTRSRRLDSQSRMILFELLKWREQRVRELNLPRRWLADDPVLVDLAVVKPKDLAHLNSFRGLNRGEVRKNGTYLLDLIHKTLESGQGLELASNSGKKNTLPSLEENHSVEFLKCFLTILADRHRISLKHLIHSRQLIPLLRSSKESVNSLVENGILNQTAADLIGEDILSFLQGECSLRMQDGIVQINLEQAD